MSEKYENGLVSVIIPTYKRSELLQKAIDTVLDQTYEKIELLVVNDNLKGDEFSQELYTLLSQYNDPRLKLVEQECHINGAAARNAGIRVAKGEFIAFQDDDDYWEKEKIERQVNLIQRLDASYGAVSCLMRIYSHGELTCSALPYRSGYILEDILTRRTSMGTGALLIRREALDEVGYFDENLVRHQDLQLFACLSAKYKIQLDEVYLHNRESKDGQNRPSVDRLIAIKKAYFESINDIMCSLPDRVRKKIYIMHDFECAYAFMKNGYVFEGLKKAFSVLKTPETFCLAINQIYRRVVETKFRYYLERKYCQKKKIRE